MPGHYRQLRLDECEIIWRMNDARLSVGSIAAKLGRHPSTIYRELRRNYFFGQHPYFRGYFGSVAHDKARRRRQCGGKVTRNPRLAAYIIDGLARAWSPEQIAGHARSQTAGGLAVCHETIYQYVYSPEGRRQELGRQLPRARKSRRRRYARKPRGLNIPLANTIAERPREIGDRQQFGHWEGDLVAFRQESYNRIGVNGLFGRKSSFCNWLIADRLGVERLLLGHAGDVVCRVCGRPKIEANVWAGAKSDPPWLPKSNASPVPPI